MSKLTITEALAEVKTINKRLATKQQFITANCCRPTVHTDPLIKDGGSEERVRQETQSHNDLLVRIERLRVAIQQANHREMVEIEGVVKSVAQWLTWRKECANHEKSLLQNMLTFVKNSRAAMEKQSTTERPLGVIVHFSENDASKRLEQIEKILGTLDGRLSLHNATCAIEVTDQ